MIIKIPGPEIHFPLWGNVNLLSEIVRNKPIGLQSKEFINLMTRLSKRYDADNRYGIFRLWFGPFVPIVVITNANLARKLLNSKDHLDKATFYMLFRFAIFDGIFTCNAEKWYQQKRELQQHFKYKALHQYVSNTERHLLLLNKRIEKCIEQNDGRFDDIKPIISTFVLDVLGDNLFSMEFRSQTTGQEPDFIHCVHKMLELSYIAFLKPWTYFFRNKLLSYLFNVFNIKNTLFLVLRFRHSIRKIIINRYKQICQDENNDKLPKVKTMLDSMIQSRMIHSKMTNLQEIQSQMNTFIIAGHDTTTSSLAWTLYLLGHHPDKQQCLMKEIDSYMNDLKINQKPITLLNMKQLKYLNSCIMESLRLYPSGPFIGRNSRGPIVVDDPNNQQGQITLPSQINYIIFIQHMHLNPMYFKYPERFYPERFLKCKEKPEENWATHSAYLPFSGGIRMCLGKEYGMMQQRMFLINLLSKFSVKSLDQYGQCQPKFNFLLSPAHFPVQFQLRSKPTIMSK